MANVIIIDDETDIRDTLADAFTRAGHQTRIASNGREALEMISSCIPDVVVTDIIMPEKEGIETIIEMHRKYSGVKVIAMSGGGRINANLYLDTAKRLGACRTFQKPFNIRELLQTVECELKNQEAAF